MRACMYIYRCNCDRIPILLHWINVCLCIDVYLHTDASTIAFKYLLIIHTNTHMHVNVLMCIHKCALHMAYEAKISEYYIALRFDRNACICTTT